MTDAKQMPAMWSRVAGGCPAGICPKCLLAAGLASDTAIRGERSDDAPTTPLPRSSRFVPPSPEELARVFPQLEILELLGEGGMGAVYKARQPGSIGWWRSRSCRRKSGADPAFAERFTREARALARLSHPHIVAVYDFGQADGLYYFVMEYVDGVNLRQAMQAGRIDAGARRWPSCRRSATPCNSPTTKASSIATSSPRTSCSTSAAA